MRSAWLVILAACHGGGGRKPPRAGSATPVEIVSQPALPDAGRGAGQTTDEVEPNDGDDIATPLPLGSTVRGKIDPEGDADHFRIDVEKPGALQLMVSAVDVDLAVDLEDASGAVIARSDRGALRSKEGVPNFGVTPGRYTAVVRAAPKKRPRAPKSAPVVIKAAPVYEISAQLVAIAANTEREPDDDRGTANDLIVGDSGTGFVGWTGDADVWKLSVEALSAKDAIDIEVSAVEGVALELEVDDGIGTPLVTRKAPRGAAVIVRGLLPVVPTGGSPFHYLVVRGAGSNPETPYQVRVTAHVVATDAEVEPDDALDKPFMMPADRTVVHATWTPGDVDCFGVAVADAARTVDATLDVPSDLALAAELLVEGKPVAEPRSKASPLSPHHVAGVIPPGGHAVIRVHGTDANATAEGTYDVHVQEAGAGDTAP